MTRVVKEWEGGGKRGLHLWCPGCDAVHGVTIDPQSWTWNGDVEKPTLSPSLLVRDGHFMPGQEQGRWCDKSGGTDPCDCSICHSFVRGGRIEFLTDSTHALAGQTVDLPPWPYAD